MAKFVCLSLVLVVGSMLPSSEALSNWVGLLNQIRNPKGLPDGSFCVLDKSGQPVKPFCSGNKYNCVADKVPNLEVQVYSGKCSSTYKRGSFCRVNGVNFRVGTQDITGNPLCQRCNCNVLASLPTRNKAVCTCDKLPPCQVNYDGKQVGGFKCPKKQNMCVITKPGGAGKDSQGRPVDLGVCVFSGIKPLCATGGTNWGPKFYLEGVSGVPKSNNRCTRCACGKGGRMSKCRAVRGCKAASA